MICDCVVVRATTHEPRTTHEHGIYWPVIYDMRLWHANPSTRPRGHGRVIITSKPKQNMNISILRAFDGRVYIISGPALEKRQRGQTLRSTLEGSILIVYIRFDAAAAAAAHTKNAAHVSEIRVAFALSSGGWQRVTGDRISF